MGTYRINCETENLLLAASAVKYGETKMPQKDAIVSYGERPNNIVFYVKKTKTGISVTQQRNTD